MLKIKVNFCFCQILTGSAIFSCRNRLFVAKLCPGSGTEFKDLVTSLVVFMHEALKILSCFHLIYSSLFFILSMPTSFLPYNFCPALTENTHHRCQRASKSVGAWGFAVLRCWCFFTAVMRWIKSQFAVLRWSQTLRCAMFVFFTLLWSAVKWNYLICGAVVSCLVFLKLKFSMLTSLTLDSFSSRLLGHVHGLSYKRAFPVSTSLKPIYWYQRYLRVGMHWQTFRCVYFVDSCSGIKVLSQMKTLKLCS